jgi:cytochrome c biogenesis protein
MATVETSADADWTVTQDRPDSPPPVRGRGPLSYVIATARRLWRWLTSMRTALILLFLMAIAAIPGSVLPQQKVSPEAVTTYYAKHPKLAPFLGHLGGFAVFASPWFSAIYLLLFISLVGCLFPRLKVYAQALRRVPPDAPRRLDRMPVFAVLEQPVLPETVRKVLRSRRYRTVVRTHDDGSVTVSAEKGYLKEAGNLLFHFSLMALLVGVAFGSWYGWHADKLLVAGQSFCSTPAEFADYAPGARVTPADLEPFCVSLNSFNATYTSSGEPSSFAAQASYGLNGATPTKAVTIKVNAPLRLAHANVYLLGHGYAPILKYTDKYGVSETTTVPFLTADADNTSTGAAVFPDVNINPATGKNTDPTTFLKDQIGFEGTYLPTVSGDTPTSVFPSERNPELFLTPYVGDLGLDNGAPQSVYSLDQAQIDSGALKPLGDPHAKPIGLKPGQSATLSDGSTVQFIGTRQWVSLSIRYDPGEKVVLAGALLLVLGLVGSLTGRRRRVWFRLAPDGTAVAGGLARAEYASFPAEFDAIVKASSSSLEGNARGNALS